MGGARPSINVLLGSEFGNGLGHVSRLLAVAVALSARGYGVIVAVRDLSGSAVMLDRHPFPRLQAPYWTPLAARAGRSYADSLVRRGFDATEHLEPRVHAWQSVIDLVEPRLVVVDNAPVLCLAAWGTIPVVSVGNGFVVPPMDREESGPRERQIEADVLAVLAEVQGRRGRPAPPSVAALLRTDARFACVLPEFDPFFTMRDEPPIGPLAPLPRPTSPNRPHLFAYLARGHPGFDDLALALAERGPQASAFIKGAPESLRRFFRSRGLRVYEEPPTLTEVLTGASAVLHHGGLGVSQAALAAGLPQVVIPFPDDLEQAFNCRILGTLGVGIETEPQAAPEALAEAVSWAIEEQASAEHAASVARELATRAPAPGLPRVIEACLRLMSDPGA